MPIHTALLVLLCASPMALSFDAQAHTASVQSFAETLEQKQTHLAQLQDTDGTQKTDVSGDLVREEQQEAAGDPADNTSESVTGTSQDQKAPEAAAPKSKKIIPKPDPAPAEQAPASGMGTWPAGALQVVAGCASVALLNFCSAYFPPLRLAVCLVPSLAVSMVGESFSQKRGAWLPSCVADNLVSNACMALSIIPAGIGVGFFSGIAYLSYLIAVLGAYSGSTYSLFCLLGLPCGGCGIVLSYVAMILGIGGSLIAGQVGSAATYQMMGDPKRPGDNGGFGFPGFISPKHPKASSKKAATPSPQAMAY